MPPAVRARVIALAEETLGSMADEDVPTSLRAIRRFTPAKRARLGAASLGAALETEESFRAAVVARVRQALPALAATVDTGAAAPAVPAVDLAAVAYLLGSADWEARVAAARPREPEPGPAGRTDPERADRLRALLETAREDTKRLRAEAAALRRETDDLRRKLNKAEGAARAAGQAEKLADERTAAAQEQRLALERELSAEARRLRSRLRDADASAAAARRGTRTGRDAQSARLRVLLETVIAGTAGLRRELDLPAVTTHPADVVAQESLGDDAGALTDTLAALRRGRAADDPTLLDEILAVPGLHLIVDGYNVTKLGYAALTLEDQRGRLVSGLAGVAARSPGVELTCIFDATAATARPVAVASPRGVRVLFSAAGELADQLIVRLAAAEPVGRPVVVVTNDREVAAAVRRAGGDALPSAGLLRRLERG
jgi:predicted RNA-binding protein with PIN domain